MLYSPRTRAFLQTAFVAVAIAAVSRWAPPPANPVTDFSRSTTAASKAAVSTTGAGVMLADEITRRLRRMGISFSRTRLPHPYDPVGEVC